MSKHLTKLKRLEKYQHWNIPYAWSLQNVLKRLAQSFGEMKTLGRGHPKLKAYKRHNWKLAIELCRSFDILFFEDSNLEEMR